MSTTKNHHISVESFLYIAKLFVGVFFTVNAERVGMDLLNNCIKMNCDMFTSNKVYTCKKVLL